MTQKANHLKATQFDLIRHGQIDGPAALYGRTDVALSPEGWQQMYQQTNRLETFDNIISSPLRRCEAFASELAADHGLTLQIEAGIQECDFGEWDGIEFDDHSQHWPLMTSFWHDPGPNTPPQGESLASFHDRVISTWQTLCKQHLGQHNLLVCHGGVIRQILAHILSTDWRSGDWYSQLQIGYASLTRIIVPSHPEAKPSVAFIGLPADFRRNDIDFE
ncbi:histidine phosphatase family protein [Paraglaciecola arctica]|uniref:histidine phosphatase family protein n=1 Tax=Paraglaciecola arctica TaxID=1128911 RepID=UPI001C06DB6B|nr:histidine phosphatase family protein [Paraglaciecola arctica]MBU3005749.1 histidine phosphatase family protein [Paraglaciecola arctica]